LRGFQIHTPKHKFCNPGGSKPKVPNKNRGFRIQGVGNPGGSESRGFQIHAPKQGHLKTCPKRPRLPPPDQQLLSFTKSKGDDSQGVVSTHKFNKDKLNEWYVRLLILEEKPFRILESKRFRAFCQFLNPQAENVSRVTMQRECMKMYTKEKMKLKEVLTSVSRIALTSNLWTTSNQRT
jgi:hypothetical protein